MCINTCNGSVILWSMIRCFWLSFQTYLATVGRRSSRQNLWSLWCSFLWSLVVLSGASFVLSAVTCWCSVLAKPLVSLVLLLWSLIVDFLQSAHGGKDSRNWSTLPWTGCLPKVFFGTSPGAPFGAFWCLCWCSVCGLSLCFFWGDFYSALLHQSTLNYARFTGMSLGFKV